MTLKKAADLTELEYWFEILEKRDLPQPELQRLYNVALLTLLTILTRLGRPKQIESVLTLL